VPGGVRVLLGFIPDLEAAEEQITTALTGQLVEKDDLVALDGAALRDRTAFHDAVVGVVLHAGDEEDAVGIEGGNPVVIGEAAIKDQANLSLTSKETK
jgi:hypothetical protein